MLILHWFKIRTYVTVSVFYISFLTYATVMLISTYLIAILNSPCYLSHWSETVAEHITSWLFLNGCLVGFMLMTTKYTWTLKHCNMNALINYPWNWNNRSISKKIIWITANQSLISTCKDGSVAWVRYNYKFTNYSLIFLLISSRSLSNSIILYSNGPKLIIKKLTCWKIDIICSTDDRIWFM